MKNTQQQSALGFINLDRIGHFNLLCAADRNTITHLTGGVK